MSELTKIQYSSLDLLTDLVSGTSTSITLMAGPCSVESEAQIFAAAEAVAAQGIPVLRGGAFKPRSSPHSFQGLGRPGLEMMRAAADEFGLLVITNTMTLSRGNGHGRVDGAVVGDVGCVFR